MLVLGIVIGIFAGAILGVFLMALLSMAHENDGGSDSGGNIEKPDSDGQKSDTLL